MSSAYLLVGYAMHLNFLPSAKLVATLTCLFICGIQLDVFKQKHWMYNVYKSLMYWSKYIATSIFFLLIKATCQFSLVYMSPMKQKAIKSNINTPI